MSSSAAAYLVDPKKMLSVIGSSDEGVAASASAFYDEQYGGFMFAPEAAGVSYATALREVLAGGPYETGSAAQYVTAFDTVIQAVAERRLNDQWGEGLGARWLSDPLDRLIGEAGCSFRFGNVLFREQNVYGLPSSDEPIVARVSRLEASGIVLEMEGVSLQDPECQETLDGFVASCRDVVNTECEMIIVYS